MLHQVMTIGEATLSVDQRLFLERHGYSEECYFSFSFSPIWEQNGRVGGIFTAVTETTERVIGQRRLRTLRDLAAHASKAKTVEEAYCTAFETIGQNPTDIPFALLYTLEPHDTRASIQQR